MPTLSERMGLNAATVHPNSRVAAALSRAGVAKTPELLRVVNLPRRVFDAKSYPDASILYAKGRCSRSGCLYCENGPPSLRPLQSAMIIEAAQNAGAFIAAGVGAGKTLASFLMHDALDAQRTMLLVPANLRDKTLNVDLPDLQKHFKLPPIYRAEDFDTNGGQNGVYVLGYSEISQTDASDLIDKIRPDLIVCDEVQNLRVRDSARTRRFLRFMRNHSCRFVAMTGSAMTKTIKDFAHLIELALGKGSPLPADYPSLTQWADAIDNEGEEGATGIGALSLMCDDHETARDGFQRRFAETAGVIVTVDPSCDLPIEIREIIPSFVPQCVLDALRKLEQDWEWDGEEFTGSLDLARLNKQITQGYFRRITWPNGTPDREWLEARNAWQRAIRKRLSHQNRVGQDSPALLEALAERGAWTPVEWADWVKVRDREEPSRVPVEISQWLVDLAATWAKEAPGIIWVSSPVLGQWLQERGIRYFGEGDDAELNSYAYAALSGQAKPETIACSIQAHGTGKNLQAWWRNLVLYPPSQGATWEQLIGRTHRPGQRSDKVTFDVILGSVSACKAMETAYEDAERIAETIGQPQRLGLAVRL
jgi:hypothetical protein